MINYILKSPDCSYYIYVTDSYLKNGDVVEMYGEPCVVISNTGKI